MKRCRITLPIFLACLIALTMVSISFGWIQNAWPSTIQFAAGSTPEYTFYKITFPKAGDTSKTASVVKGDSIGAPVDGFGFTADDEGNLNTELQFGTITNLYFLEDDNYVFYAVEIPYSMGTGVNAAVSYGAYDPNEENALSVAFGEHFKIYDKNLAQITDTAKLGAVKNIEVNEASTFVTYACALSAQSPVDDEGNPTMTFEEMDALFQKPATGENTTLMDSFKNQDGTPKMLPVATNITKTTQNDTVLYYADPSPVAFDTFTGTATNGKYYLYIKLQPNMELYKYFVDILYADMPFYLAYQVGIKLYVTPETNS